MKGVVFIASMTEQHSVEVGEGCKLYYSGCVPADCYFYACDLGDVRTGSIWEGEVIINYCPLLIPEFNPLLIS